MPMAAATFGGLMRQIGLRAGVHRGSAAKRGYGRRWQQARRRWLVQHPLCVMCQAAGRVVPATVVDHIIPHRGAARLFWDRENWQSLCERHHNAKSAMERGGGAK